MSKRFGRKQKRKLKEENERLKKLVIAGEAALIRAEKNLEFPHIKTESMVMALIPDLRRLPAYNDGFYTEMPVLHIQIDPMPMMFSKKMTQTEMRIHREYPQNLSMEFAQMFQDSLERAIPKLLENV